MSLRGWPSLPGRWSWSSFYGAMTKRVHDATVAVIDHVWPVVREIGSAVINAALVTVGVVIIGLTMVSFFR